ncbi:hypothetical protein [Phycicoccus sp. 3266]|uniref:hypothetical protein n=1 Tax=Phycicoccus sp. 3266 TaxID=2817751 RepID=UPI002862512E|nr:hypothetical protein [Phycicoccus sp. 3266]MDR6861991.1 hypothetical protein [Phycicoccus sp. 3266]
MTNPFVIIPAQVRLYLYLVYGVATLIISAVAAYAGALQHDVPEWAIGTGGALVPIGAALAGMAASNTTKSNTAVVEAPADVAITPAPADEP